MFLIVVTQSKTVVSVHTATSLEAVHMDLITDGLPATMQIKDAVSLLGQITVDGGVIALPGGGLITVTVIGRDDKTRPDHAPRSEDTK
jgi:hypothetical protein